MWFVINLFSYYVNGNQLTNVGYKRFVIDGDSVTFGFISDDSYGDYGYYAIIKAQIDITLLNPIEQPTVDNDLIFYGWCSNPICTKANKVDPNALLYNDTIYAYWSEKESELDKGKFRTYTNVLNTNGYIPQTKIKRATADEYNQVKDTLDDSNIISTTESPVPTYCWKTQDTIYYYSIGTIYLPEDSSDLFWLFRYVEELDVSGFDTSRVKSMEMMFSQMERIKKLDLSTFNTSQVTNMRQMFGIMNTLEELDISNFDTKNVTNMGSMFGSSSNIKVLDLSSFDTSSVDNFREMFMSCNSLEKIYVSDKFVINTNNTYLINL